MGDQPALDVLGRTHHRSGCRRRDLLARRPREDAGHQRSAFRRALSRAIRDLTLAERRQFAAAGSPTASSHMCAYWPPSRGDEVVVVPFLDDDTVVDDHDPVGEARGLQTVRDEDRRAPVGRDAHRGLHLRLGLQVEVRRGFVE